MDFMGDDASIVRAARVSYAGDLDEHSAERDEKLLRYLLRNGHTSPFEHVVFTFRVSAPIFVARQWMRHRTWSFNEISARYAELPNRVYQPEEWRGQASHNKQMSDGAVENQQAATDAYNAATDAAFAAYEQLIGMGVAREQARAVLPVGVYTDFYATVDLHNFLHFVRLRDHEHAQPEIRNFAGAMKRLVQNHVPVTMKIWEELQ